jgi:hypothetical protein
MKKLFLFTVTMVICSYVGFSQNYIDILNLRYNYFPEAELNSEKVNVQEYYAGLTLPLYTKGEDMAGIGMQYGYFSIDNDNVALKDLQLHTIKLRMLAYKTLANPKWSVYAELIPKLNSDLKNVSSSHFQIGGIALMNLKKGDDYFWHFGLFFNMETFGPFPLPLIGFDKKLSEKCYINVLLPPVITFEYKLNKHFYSGAEVELVGETYRLGGSDFEDSFISQFGESKLYFLIKTRLFIDYYITKNLVFYLKPGFRFLRKYEHYSEDDELIMNSDYLSGELKQGFYLETGIALRVRFEDE